MKLNSFKANIVKIISLKNLHNVINITQQKMAKTLFSK